MNTKIKLNGYYLGGKFMRTTFMANAKNIERKWYVIDAEGQTLGRLLLKLHQFYVVNINQHIHHMLTLVIMLLL